jgi:glycosyltransferase involved in cell wall biosynthesis
MPSNSSSEGLLPRIRNRCTPQFQGQSEMKEPLVSVHMITYNHAPYIAQAIEAVLMQKRHFPIELIVGEDCSTDGTREIVYEYQKKHPDIIMAITSDRNVGPKKNAYRTMKACRGKYIAFCEGDDYWHHPEKLQIQVDYMEGHPECGLHYSDCDIYYEESKKLVKRFNFSKGFTEPRTLNIEEIMWGRDVHFTCTVVVRREPYESIIESDPYLHQSEHFQLGDQQAWAELSLVSEIKYIPECLGTYRVLTESASRSNDNARYWRFYKSVNEMRLYLCGKYNLSDEFCDKERRRAHDIDLRIAFYERDTALAVQALSAKRMPTLSERFRYLGAKYSIVNYGYRCISCLLGKIRRANNEWP